MLTIVVPLAFSAIGAEAVPDATGVLFTVTVALASVVVGVTVSDVVAALTEVV